MKSSSFACAVLLGASFATPAAADAVRLAQTFVSDVIPPHEVFTIARSMGLHPISRLHFRGRSYVLHATDRRGEEVRVVIDAYAARVVSVMPVDREPMMEDDAPRVHRRYGSVPPPPLVIETRPRYAPPPPSVTQPRYGAPQAMPDDDDDPDAEPDQFDDDEDYSETGPLPPRDTPRALSAPRMSPVPPSTRSASVTPPGTPLPRPRPDLQVAAPAPADKPETSKPDTSVAESDAPAPNAPSSRPAPETKADSGAPAGTKTDPAKTEAPKSGIRIIEIKRPEPRI